MWEVAAGEIRDIHRFGYRGAMLDVARHFFKPDDVKKYMDSAPGHRSQSPSPASDGRPGVENEIKSWDKLATHGGRTAVGGGTGRYTQDEYHDLVQYAADRFITIVPEIDMPGHTNAALASYPELNCTDQAPGLYTE